MRVRELALWPLAVAGATAGALLILHAGPPRLLVRCPLRVWTSVPCPTCGGTQAALELSRGHVLAALAANPLVACVILAVLVSGVAALIALPWAGRIRPPRRPSGRLMAIVVAALLLLNWVYLIVHLM